MTEPQVLDLTALRLPPETVSHAQSLVGVAERAVIATDKDLADSASVVAQINSHLTKIDADKDRVAAPLNQALKAFYAIWHESRDPLDAAKKIIIGKQNAYNAKREAEREAEEKRLREEAEAKAMEEAAAREAEAKQLAEKAAAAQKAGDTEAAAEFAEAAQEATAEAAEALEEAVAPIVNLPPPPPAVARGTFGGVGFKTVWKADVENWDLVFAIPSIRDNQKVKEAIYKVIDAAVRGGTRSMAGVKIYSVKEANNRR